MGNHILHIKYEVIQQNIILFTFKKINYRICNYHNVNNVFSAKMVWCRNSNDKKKFSFYIFRIIAHLFDLEGYLLWFDTWI